MTSIIEAIKKSKNILVASHRGPDGDAIGSTLALGLGLEKLGKNVSFFNQDNIPVFLKFLPGSDRFLNSLDTVACDTIIMVDCADLDRVGDLLLSFHTDQVIINIDHHSTNTRFGDAYFIEPTVSSTGEVIFDLLTELKCPIDEEIATNLFCALVADTGSFKYANTTSKVLYTAAALIEAGALPEEVSRELWDTYPFERVLLLSRVLPSIKLHLNGKVATVVVTDQDLKETGSSIDLTEGFIDILRGIDGLEVAILFKERKDGKVKIGTRARGNVDVAKFCQVFGGGGHRAAAGALIEGSIKDVMERALKEVEKHLP